MKSSNLVWLLTLSLLHVYPGLVWAQHHQTRPASSDAELRSWLENMSWHHGYSLSEMSQVTGLTEQRVSEQLARFNISQVTRPARPTERMFVLPYPGGRHPRIGFLEGAVAPQRDTKLSVFPQWDETSYAVIDVPEAVWSNLGLTYLAHSHIDTLWTKQNVTLPQLEWRSEAGGYQAVRTLPNRIQFGVQVVPWRDHLRMKMWLTNATDQTLSDLRVQNCVMLKGMAGFDQQTNDNKQFTNDYAVVRAADAPRWIITAWDPLHRNWGNARCPCLHSDPKFPNCPPGKTVEVRGWFSFYEGTDLDGELRRIESTGWRTADQ